MHELLIALVAMLAAGLTFFSGFGLNTILMPVLALMLPTVESAIAAAAIVHLCNGLFKASLMRTHADLRVVVRFGLVGMAAALFGAFLLDRLGGIEPITTYSLWGHTRTISALKLVVGLMIVMFAALELSPLAERWRFDERWLPLGGALSGFFGGLSGHQGALRACFLVRAGLNKERLIGTGAMCAAMIDVARLSLYIIGAKAVVGTGHAGMFDSLNDRAALMLVAAGIAGALCGSLIGKRLLTKATLKGVQWIVGVMLLAAGLAMATGLI